MIDDDFQNPPEEILKLVETAEKGDFDVRKKQEPTFIKPEEEKPLEREMIFTGPFNKVDSPQESDEYGEDSLLKDDDFDNVTERYGDQVINDEGDLEIRSVKQRLQQQSKDRLDKMKAARKQEMTKEEFNEKWSLPAYLRRGVKMQDVPHSAEPFISKYNLNDDNNLLGNNKFLHDNVD